MLAGFRHRQSSPRNRAFLYSSGLQVWTKEYRKNQLLFVQKADAYKSEGMAELCQYLVLKPFVRKYPMLYHANLLKHYIFRQSPGNHHTWGFLWMRTVFQILNNDFPHVFSLVGRPGLSLDELLAASELQTEGVRAVSQDVSPRSFPRQKRSADRPHTYVFPSCVLEVEGDAFRVVEHGTYSLASGPSQRRR